MAAVLVSRLLGLLRDRFLASYFFDGTAWQLDVYFAAFRLPDMVFQLLVVGALSAAFIPVFTRYLVKNRQEAWHVASTVISLGLVFFFVFGRFYLCFSRPFEPFDRSRFFPGRVSFNGINYPLAASGPGQFFGV